MIHFRQCRDTARSLLAGGIAVAVLAVSLIALDPVLHRLAHSVGHHGTACSHDHGEHHPERPDQDPASPTHQCPLTVFGDNLDRPVIELLQAAKIASWRLPHQDSPPAPVLTPHGFTRRARAPPALA